MSDNRTIEPVSYREVRTLLAGFLCEYQNILLSRGINASEAVCKQNELVDEYAERIEQAIAATLGSGTLTAEQVRNAIFRGSTYTTYDGTQYYASGIDMQAIADELNSLLSSKTCELIYGENDDGVDSWFTECGGRFNATFENGRMVRPKFCQLCGGEAVKR